ncbi:hypothetical protein LTR46_008521 [Exophiala xenobiotica]|nr:hypothetical protein LTR46_008521 [Exophiala xenobiotica]
MVQDLNPMATKPTVVIVPGSFSPAYFYDVVVDKLRENGFETIVDNLPSASRSPPEPAATMADDAAFFHDIVEKLADQGKDVVLVTHSYGGVVGTEASKGLSKSERTEAGKYGGLVRLVYLTSVVPTPGNSLGDLMGTLLPTYIKFDGEYMKHEPFEESARLTFSDLPPEEGVEWVKKMPLHSAPSFQGKLTYPGYKYVPVSWIFCEYDLILPPDFQRQCIEMIEKESGNKVDIHSIKTGHVPNASAPEDTAMAIMDAVKAS